MLMAVERREKGVLIKHTAYGQKTNDAGNNNANKRIEIKIK